MLVYWIWLAQLRGVSNPKKLELLQQYGDPEALYLARGQEQELAQARQILSECRQKGVSITAFFDSTYPRQLKNIKNAPLVLYCKGTMPELEEVPAVAIVGTRKASEYAQSCAYTLGKEIAAAGAVVVSGAAEGIDTQALLGALDAGGQVVAVLGFGTDTVYPASNRQLFERIARQGCLITEYPPAMPVYPANFLQRNRIISGLSRGVVIVEAPQRSGAMSTARYALDQGRDLFVVPGPIDDAGFAGSNSLLRGRAIPVLSARDVTDCYQSLFARMQPVAAPASDKKVIDKQEKSNYSVLEKRGKELSAEAMRLAAQMTNEPMPLDVIAEAAEIPTFQAMSILTELVVEGIAQCYPGGYVALK